MAIAPNRSEQIATVIGESITVSGNLTGDEDLTVQGRVEGSITLSRTLILETSGIIKADVKVKNAIISGVVVGNLTASDSVELTAECRMVGDISAPRVIIVEGASFRGRVDMGDLDMPRAEGVERTGRPARAAAPRPAMAPRTVPPPRTAPAQAAAKTVTAGPSAPASARPPAPPPVPPSAVALGAKRKVIVKKK